MSIWNRICNRDKSDDLEKLMVHWDDKDAQTNWRNRILPSTRIAYEKRWRIAIQKERIVHHVCVNCGHPVSTFERMRSTWLKVPGGGGVQHRSCHTDPYTDDQLFQSLMEDLHASWTKNSRTSFADRERTSDFGDYWMEKDTIRALVALGDCRAVPDLIRRLPSNPKNPLDNDIVIALGMLPDRMSVEPLIRVLGSYHSAEAAWSLGQIGDNRAIVPLIHALGNDYAYQEAAQALVKLGEPKWKSMLPIKTGNAAERYYRTLENLFASQDPRIFEPVVEIVSHNMASFLIWFPEEWIISLLKRLDHNRLADSLIFALSSKDCEVRVCSALALGLLGDVRAVAPLQRALEDMKPRGHASAVSRILAKLTPAQPSNSEKTALSEIADKPSYVEEMILRNVIAAFRRGSPTELTRFENREGYCLMLQFIRAWVADGDYPRLTVVGLAASGNSKHPNIIIRQGNLDQVDYQETMPISEWRDRVNKYLGTKTFVGTEGVYHNYSSPGKSLVSTDRIDCIVSDIEHSIYTLDAIVAINGRPQTESKP